MSSSAIVFAYGLLALSPAGFSQEYRGRVQGVVTDPSSAVAPGASVVLRNVETGIEAARLSNDIGRYLFDYVDPGTYSVTVQLAGFKKYSQTGIIVSSAAM